MPEKLTDARVRGASPREKRYSILDSKEAGLELRVHPDGRRVFALRRSVNGRDVRVTIGPYGQEPPGFTLERARGQAAALKLRFRNEGDFRENEKLAQAAERERRRYTVDDLATEWLAHASKRLRPSTIALHTVRIDTHIRPAFGKRPLADVSRADVRQLINRLGEDRAVTANRVAQLISGLFKFARTELERDVANPAADLKPFKESARQRVLSDAEIGTLMEALDNPDLPPGPQTAIALKLCVYSAQRSGEIIGARDNELDFAEGVWRVPGERTKSGNPNTVPLTPKLAALFEQARALRPQIKDGETRRPLPADAPIFPAPGNPTKPMQQHSLSTAMARLCEDLEWIGDRSVTPHDLRRTARTILGRERLRIPFEDAERVMSHAFGSAVARTYLVDSFITQKRRALETLGIEIDRIIAGVQVESADNVIELSAARSESA